MAIPPWIEVLGGGPRWPSSVSYVAYNLTTIGASITLEFPWMATTNYVTAGTIAVTLNNSAYTITMPDVTQVAPGYIIWVVNNGSVTLTIKKSDGTTLETIIASRTYGLQVTNNTTAAGTWQTWQFAAGTSSATAASLTGPGITTNPLAPSRLALEVDNKTIPSGDYDILVSDRALLLLWDNGTGTITLPDSTDPDVNPGFFCYISNLSDGGLVTLAAQGIDTINDESSITINPSISFQVVLGENGAYYTIGLPNFSIVNFSFPDGDISTPSIHFQGDILSGFSFTPGTDSSQAINASLHGVLQAKFALVGGVSYADFQGTIKSYDGAYVFGQDATKTRIELADADPEQRLNFIVYNAAGNAFTELVLRSDGFLTYSTDPGAQPVYMSVLDLTVGVGSNTTPAIVFNNGTPFFGFYIEDPSGDPYLALKALVGADPILQIADAYINTPISDYQRKGISYLAWSRIM